MNIQLTIGIVLLAALGSVSTVSYIYYKSSQATIKIQAENIAKLSVAVETQKETIAALDTFYRKQTAILNELTTVNSELQAEKIALSDKLIKHDLEELSRRKPVLVEKIINDGTKKLLDSFTTLTTN